MAEPSPEETKDLDGHIADLIAEAVKAGHSRAEVRKGLERAIEEMLTDEDDDDEED